MKLKSVLGIIITGCIIGFIAGSIIAYPAGAYNAVTNPVEAMQLTVYAISGQDEKVAELEEEIINGKQSPGELEEVPKEEDYPHVAQKP